MKLIGYSSDDLIPPEVKKKQFAGARCCYCDIKLTRENFSREHVLPKSKGGRNKKFNKLPCCTACNSQKANKTLDEYEKWLQETKPDNWSFKVLMCQQIER